MHRRSLNVDELFVFSDILLVFWKENDLTVDVDFGYNPLILSISISQKCNEYIHLKCVFFFLIHADHGGLSGMLCMSLHLQPLTCGRFENLYHSALFFMFSGRCYIF